MSLKSILHDLKEIKDGIGSISRRGVERKHWRDRAKSHVAPDVAFSEPIGQGQWANLPPELLLDIIRRIEESETTWPARASVVSCASVCRSWRYITKKIVKTPEQCGRLTFPISLKQPGPRDAYMHCFVERDRTTSTYRLYFSLIRTEENEKLLLTAKEIKRVTGTDFVISLVEDDFSQTSNTYVGKLRSNILGTKFSIYDNQPPNDAAAVRHSSPQSRRSNAKHVSPRLPASNYKIATISYGLNILRTRGPRKMKCVMLSIPVSSIQEGVTAPTPTSFPHCSDEKSVIFSKENGPATYCSSPKIGSPPMSASPHPREALVLENIFPSHNEHLLSWCWNRRGGITVASVENFQLVAVVDPSPDMPAAEEEKVILQFGKVAKDVFTLDYQYPLSAFQAFAICLSSFHANPTCE